MKNPKLIFPLLIVWSVFAPVVVYLQFFVDWEAYGLWIILLVLFAFILGLSVLLSFSCFILLEQIRRIESDEPAHLLESLPIAFTNTLHAFPVTLCWALIWLALSIVESILRRGNNCTNDEFTAENVAKTLGGFESFSLSGAFFEALRKGVRMVAFLIFPAIAWESGKGAVKRGINVARIHRTEFATGFVLTELAAAIVFLPPALLFTIAGETGVEFCDSVWFATIIYCGFAWSISMLIEQLFTAELYLWDMKWRKECARAEARGNPPPALCEVPRPSILDETPEFRAALGE